MLINFIYSLRLKARTSQVNVGADYIKNIHQCVDLYQRHEIKTIQIKIVDGLK